MSRRVQKNKKIVRPSCPKCGEKNPIKSGLVQGEQRWKCTACHFQFTRIVPRGRPLWQKSLVLFLYSYGMSLRSIAKLLQIQPSTALKWVRALAEESRPGLVQGLVEVMEMDAMRRLLKKKKAKDSPVLCLMINDADLKKSLGIRLESLRG